MRLVFQSRRQRFSCLSRAIARPRSRSPRAPPLFLPPDLGDELARTRLPLDLLECALPRRLVGAPADELRAMAEPAAAHMIVAHLDDQLGPKRLPLPGPLRRPAARPARRIAGESRAAAERLELARQHLALAPVNGRREADMVEQACLVVEAEEQRPDELAVRAVTEAADNAIGSAQPLHLEH